MLFWSSESSLPVSLHICKLPRVQRRWWGKAHRSNCFGCGCVRQRTTPSSAPVGSAASCSGRRSSWAHPRSRRACVRARQCTAHAAAGAPAAAAPTRSVRARAWPSQKTGRRPSQKKHLLTRLDVSAECFYSPLDVLSAGRHKLENCLQRVPWLSTQVKASAETKGVSDTRTVWWSPLAIPCELVRSES